MVLQKSFSSSIFQGGRRHPPKKTEDEDDNDDENEKPTTRTSAMIPSAMLMAHQYNKLYISRRRAMLDDR